MRKSKLALLLAAAFVAVTAMSAIVYASEGSSGSMTGRGMMGGSMMGMSRMMGHCGDMMGDNRGSNRPNDQWRDGRSPTPDDHN